MTLKIELQGLIDWLRTKPVDETYIYDAPSRCLLQQYLTHLGGLDVSVGPDQYDYLNPVDELSPRIGVIIDPPINMVAEGNPDGDDPRKFGDALERALQLQATGYKDTPQEPFEYHSYL